MRTSRRLQERIRMFDQRLARLRAERERLLARASEAERRRDTRRKIIIGGTVLAAISDEGVPALRSSEELTRWLDARLERPFERVVCGLSRRETA